MYCYVSDSYIYVEYSFAMLTLIICIALLSVTTEVVQGMTLYKRPEGFTVHKLVSTWEEAQLLCQSEGAVIASPINTELLEAMRYYIGIKSTPYLIGTRATHYGGPFTSVEGVQLENMTDVMMNMVEKLDPRDGDCLSMDQYNIRVVPCCARLPFMCYKAQAEPRRITMTQTEGKYISAPIPFEMADVVTENVRTEEMEHKITEDDVIDKLKQPEIPSEITEHSTTEVKEHMTTDDDGLVVIKAQDRSTSKCANDTEYKYYESTGSCYKVHRVNKTWDDAASACAAEGAHLVVVDDSTEAEVIKQLNLRHHPESFVGLRDFKENGEWKSVTGKSMSEIYNVWYFGKPLVVELRCGVIDYNGKLDNFACDSVREFVCEK